MSAALLAIGRDAALRGRMIGRLEQAGLPVSDLDEGDAEYFALGDGAFGGLVVDGLTGLLRSIVVAPEHRGGGAGSALVMGLLAHAKDRGVCDVWLLTTSAERFFARHGFARAERAQAPQCIAATSQFRDLCPSSAVLMHRTLS